MPASTLLGLELVGGDFELSEYAARGLSMTLAPIDAAAHLERDINGNMVDLSADQFKKYKASISCSDQESPGFAEMSSLADEIWPGSIFTVTCIPQLGKAAAMTLTMMVTVWEVSRDEYGAVTEWSLQMEEV